MDTDRQVTIFLLGGRTACQRNNCIPSHKGLG